MTAKEYLMQLGLLDARINNKRQELASMRMLLQGIQGVNYSYPKVQTPPVADTIGKNIARCMCLEHEIEDEGSLLF